MICVWPGCQRSAPKGGYCFLHGAKYGTSKLEVKKTPIAKVSANRKELEKEYSKLKKEMMKEGNKCEAGLTGCTKVAEDLHHITKRSTKNMCDRNNLIRVCRSCHTFIENNHLQAIELGLSKSKHKL